MTRIELQTSISAPIDNCFNLSRSIDVHQLSTPRTNEKAVGGRLSGLCEKGDTVTWRAKHFGFYQHLTMEITAMDPPVFFEDRMVKGIFRTICHKHYFSEKDGYTVMKDVFEYEVPAGMLGRAFDAVVLQRYMTRLLVTRNQVIKQLAEDQTQLSIHNRY